MSKPRASASTQRSTMLRWRRASVGTVPLTGSGSTSPNEARPISMAAHGTSRRRRAAEVRPACGDQACTGSSVSDTELMHHRWSVGTG